MMSLVSAMLACQCVIQYDKIADDIYQLSVRSHTRLSTSNTTASTSPLSVYYAICMIDSDDDYGTGDAAMQCADDELLKTYLQKINAIAQNEHEPSDSDDPQLAESRYLRSNLWINSDVVKFSSHYEQMLKTTYGTTLNNLSFEPRLDHRYFSLVEESKEDYKPLLEFGKEVDHLLRNTYFFNQQIATYLLLSSSFKFTAKIKCAPTHLATATGSLSSSEKGSKPSQYLVSGYSKHSEGQGQFIRIDLPESPFTLVIKHGPFALTHPSRSTLTRIMADDPSMHTHTYIRLPHIHTYTHSDMTDTLASKGMTHVRRYFATDDFDGRLDIVATGQYAQFVTVCDDGADVEREDSESLGGDIQH